MQQLKCLSEIKVLQKLAIQVHQYMSCELYADSYVYLGARIKERVDLSFASCKSLIWFARHVVERILIDKIFVM